jgi:uncharacterized protein (DUF924 family)
MMEMRPAVAPEDVLAFWFSDETIAKWFNGGAAFDALCRERFSHAIEAAKAGELDHWTATPEGALALVILLDQMTRNVYRGTPAAFSGDAAALAVAKAAIAQGFDAATPPGRRNFFYLPFQHSEILTYQDRGMELYATNDVEDGLMWMTRHRDVIARFGRFPHRNAILGRASTAEEEDFLQQPGSKF